MSSAQSPNPMMKLEDFPREILLPIFARLTGSDIANIGKCNRALRALSQDVYLWIIMTKTRFPRLYKQILKGNNDICPEDLNIWREHYMQKDDCRISAANDMARSNASFFRTEKTQESIYGAVVEMTSVCWYDTWGVIEGVPPGRYRLQWRKRISRSAYVDEPLDYVARALRDGEGEQSELRYTAPSAFFYRDKNVANGNWMIWTIPGEFVIKDEWGFTDVRVSNEKRTNWWKSSIAIDWVRLIPINQVDSRIPLLTSDSSPQARINRNHSSSSVRKFKSYFTRT
ncbi:hypothetical protein BJV82DRAFT_631698 [Fennellomyces sp. T-0311]|nr:hypothetical protein BJV82DRAFT_631698 [Fennellomyces sp. T-0311]